MVNVSTLGQYLDQIKLLKGQQQTMGDLTTQIASGKKTQTLSGLGGDIVRTTRARSGVNELNVYNDNITNANRRIKLMTSAITQMKEQASNIQGALTTAVQQGDYPDLKSIQALSSSVYDFVTDLINQTDGERYLFGGADTSEPPISDGGLYQSALGKFVPDETDLTNPPLVTSGMIGDWGDGTITTDQFLAAYKNTPESVLGFSNTLTSGTAGKSTVRVSDASEFDYTKLANAGPMKEIVRALGLLKQLPPVEHAPGALNDPNATTLAQDVAPNPPKAKQEAFFKVINDIAATLAKATDGLESMAFDLSQVQAQITIVKDSNTEQVNAYKDIIGEVEDVDITEASAKISQMQVQLQASFQVTAMLSQLTLANFLS